MAANPQLTPAEFAQKIKAQYPVYHDIPDDELASKMLEKYPQYRDLVKTEPAPNAAPGSGLGVMQSAFQTAKDLGVGAINGLGHTVLDAGELVQKVPGVTAAVDKVYGVPGISRTSFQELREATPYHGTAQQIGGAAETVGELAVPVTKGASAVVEALPSAEKAAQGFQSVMGAARKVPIDVTDAGNVALRIQELAERGGSMPMAVRKFVNRITDPSKAPMEYEEARDFASNISRLSADEFNRLTPVVKNEVIKLRVALNAANAKAASIAGKGQEYVAAMNQYAKAKQLEGVWNSLVEGAKKGLPYATAAGAGTYLTKKLMQLVSGE